MQLLLAFLFAVSASAMTQKELHNVSMENDAQFIECAGNIYFAIANLQRVSVEDLTWEESNPEYQKVQKARESLVKASQNLGSALEASDLLLTQLEGEKKKAFQAQLSGFKKQIQDLKVQIGRIVAKFDNNSLPKVEDVHRMVALAQAGIGYGMDVSKKNTKAKN